MSFVFLVNLKLFKKINNISHYHREIGYKTFSDKKLKYFTPKQISQSCETTGGSSRANISWEYDFEIKF
jgi:hypothetical protein